MKTENTQKQNIWAKNTEAWTSKTWKDPQYEKHNAKVFSRVQLTPVFVNNFWVWVNLINLILWIASDSFTCILTFQMHKYCIKC